MSDVVRKASDQISEGVLARLDKLITQYPLSVATAYSMMAKLKYMGLSERDALEYIEISGKLAEQGLRQSGRKIEREEASLALKGYIELDRIDAQLDAVRFEYEQGGTVHLITEEKNIPLAMDFETVWNYLVNKRDAIIDKHKISARRRKLKDE